MTKAKLNKVAKVASDIIVQNILQNIGDVMSEVLDDTGTDYGLDDLYDLEQQTMNLVIKKLRK